MSVGYIYYECNMDKENLENCILEYYCEYIITTLDKFNKGRIFAIHWLQIYFPADDL